ncbi:hypothetical protein LF1_30100 [Rubripirellula obstinata]|uniref:DUF1559 domain-containing protein n=1 Tax=Rubripirellula obstinata TaxID=406547 RepID=A0A5B1CLQ9_9BACT|nr:DUF1559 domain-containing protein [Rubripirellula obstinata]KAA1260470.1 hypothetical protein LF1_30100 [Rubripirellula obstinata]
MPFLFTCPHCETKTQVDDQYSGKQGQCVSCGGEITLPRFASATKTKSKPARRDSKLISVLAATAVCSLILGSLLFAIIRFGGQTMATLSNSREQTTSMRNLEKIAAAMNAYAADHGTYPAPMTVNSNGTPLHSWRVLLLPYLGEEDLYDRINLRLPWDHAENAMVMQYSAPLVYQHPSSTNNGFGSGPAYFLITGTGTLFPPTGPLSPNDVTDDVTQTLLVVEGSPVTPPMSWAEPVDLPFSMMTGRLAGNPGSEPGGLLEGGVAAATVDGRGHFIRDEIAPADFLSLVTPTGGERLRDDTLD